MDNEFETDAFDADDNERGGSPMGENSIPASDRGGFGHEGGGLETSALKGNPHSSSGFKRAIRQQSGHGRLLNDAKSGKSPVSRFAQGGKTHGMHVGGGHMGGGKGTPTGGGL